MKPAFEGFDTYIPTEWLWTDIKPELAAITKKYEEQQKITAKNKQKIITDKEKIKTKALKKLTPEERAVLGL